LFTAVGIKFLFICAPFKIINSNTVHIISFDVPYPADYGGAIDVFYKVEALQQKGIQVILHCFEYGRKQSDILNNLCKKVHYYRRDMSFVNLLSSVPFIVNTRKNQQLLSNLLLDDFPILFEGIHTCYFLNHPKLKNRTRIVRTHNIEHDYYLNLSRAEHKFFQKLYLKFEAKKLRRFEQELSKASGIAAISLNDQKHFIRLNSNTKVVSAFHQNTQVHSHLGKGSFVLYHGNLGVAENYQAAMYLIEEVFSKTNHPFVIAGNNAPDILRKLCSKFQNVRLYENLNTESILKLVGDAHINLLVTKQATGIKLKLLAALYNGRFCLVNKEMVIDTGLEAYCNIGDSSTMLLEKANELMNQSFTPEMLVKRKELENSIFSNSYNVNQLISLLVN
jgi:hypothetical protein